MSVLMTPKSSRTTVILAVILNVTPCRLGIYMQTFVRKVLYSLSQPFTSYMEDVGSSETSVNILKTTLQRQTG